MLAVSATESLSILSKNSQVLITTLSSNIQTFRNCLLNVKYVNIEGSKDSPVLHLRINEDVIKIGNGEDNYYYDNITNNNDGSGSIRNFHNNNGDGNNKNNNSNISSNHQEKEKLLQDIVNEAMNNGVLLTRSKYVRNQELFNVEPSIRICISTIFTKKEIEKSANAIKLAINKILKNKVK